ncbi:MAG: transcription-repair coupling factor [Firmicutes bacterium]|nr:transcription-repair coupling factor [Bacillota bacterium]
MGMQGLLSTITQSEDFAQLRSGLRLGLAEQAVIGLVGSQKASYIAGLYEEVKGNLQLKKGPLFVITYTIYRAEQLHADLMSFIPQEDLFFFPPQEVYVYEEVTRNLDILRDRLLGYRGLLERSTPILIVPIQALAEKLIPPEVFLSQTFTVNMESRVDLEELSARLVNMGYQRVDLVDAPAQFSIRGGIVDIYPLTEELPVRVELFDDEVDSIRRFNPETQRSTEKIPGFKVVPASEFILPESVREEGIETLRQQGDLQVRRLERAGNAQGAVELEERLAAHLEKFEERVAFEGMEQHKPYFYTNLVSLLDYADFGYVIFDEPARINEHLRSFLSDFEESYKGLLEKGRLLPGTADNYHDWSSIINGARRHYLLYLAALSKRAPGMSPLQTINVHARPPDSFQSKLDRLAASLRGWQQEGYSTVIVVSTEERAQRLVEVLKDYDIVSIFVPEVTAGLISGNVLVSTGNLEAGFELPRSRLVVLTENEIYGRSRRTRRSRSIEGGVRITDYSALREGDYVVHINHGIGRYLGIQTLEVAGVHKDYLVVQYAGADRLYVPTEQVGLLQKYVGSEDGPPKLYKLGGGEWARVKKRVKESVHELAEGLLQLYAQRETIQGFQFSPDTVWQAEFEAAFPYEPTPDQLKAIEEVKRDMEAPKPMDRLLCGDVGYGKTEVAIRAAFKAIMDGKQVAVLVPTTILAQQHYRTFIERFEGYPAIIHVLSRFQSPIEQAASLKQLKEGKVDIIIGTHRLLSKDVVFKDLGLVIVDEEQRFGVAQKERLKQLRKSVDVLTLTATPIPRTLHMSLVGVRDMSLIETPPENRFPIRTYVIEYNDEVIREAIQRELAREGQVYFVYNRVQTIDRMAAHIMDLVPEARLAVAHGQMDENRLERIMLDFLHGEYDILLCTTIIETGMDISNVNTLIVYDADQMGLAQLYQLRGRVGRTNRVAYAYFTYRRDKLLTETAEKRLQAIKEFTDLGSGYKIAMRDLEIRGAGNLLGPEQHGFIASVGFELYCRLLEESIRELKGEVKQEPPEPVIDLDIDAYLPDSYVADPAQKVEFYKRIAELDSRDEAGELLEEIEDRFGEAPAAAYNLLAVARIKVLARELGIGSISQKRDQFIIRMLSGLDVPEAALRRLPGLPGKKLRFLARRGSQLRFRSLTRDGQEVLGDLEQVLVAMREALVEPSVV